MDENPLRTNVLTPGRLVMRMASCFYCGNHEYNDYNIEHLFGIRYCAEHKSWAVRDCRAYCRTDGRIPLSWMMKEGALTELLNTLKSGAQVKRSSGSIEEWRLSLHSYWDQSYITKFEQGWAIPMMTRDMLSAKCVLIDELRDLNPQIAPTLFDTAKEFLADLYTAEVAEHLAASQSGESKELPEDPRIKLMMVGSKEVRVFCC